jgi:hypothetical protein
VPDGVAIRRAEAVVEVMAASTLLWALTGDDNTAALAAYRSAGGTPDPPQRMLTWTFTRD